MFQVMVIWTGTWMIWDSDVLFVDCQLEDKVSWVYLGYLFKRVVKKARHRGMAHMFHGHVLFHIVSYCFIGFLSGKTVYPVGFIQVPGRIFGDHPQCQGLVVWMEGGRPMRNTSAEAECGKGMSTGPDGDGSQIRQGDHRWLCFCFDYEPFPFLLETQNFDPFP